MKIKTLILGDLHTNVYVVYDEEYKDAIVIDPAAEEDKIIQFIDENNLNLKGILITHGHYDHFRAANKVRDTYGVPVFASIEESEAMENPNINLSVRFTGTPIIAKADEIINDGDIIEFSELVFQCIKVPGHSSGSICFYSEENKVLFCGDTLFASAIGRTDFYDGPQDTLITEIKSKLMCLPEETKVYPGHGLRTTIDYESRANAYLLY
ncbi:MAG: MBL fold metallo-hydrolase [Vallitalea sp.]|nr:MBL fold metallo-hydrolase [Vallitalea sp.]